MDQLVQLNTKIRPHAYGDEKEKSAVPAVPAVPRGGIKYTTKIINN